MPKKTDITMHDAMKLHMRHFASELLPVEPAILPVWKDR